MIILHTMYNRACIASPYSIHCEINTQTTPRQESRSSMYKATKDPVLSELVLCHDLRKNDMNEETK